MDNQQVATGPSKLAQVLAPVRAAVFGKQNERLEYIMDSYLKFTPEQRTAAVAGSIVAFVLVVIGIVLLYLSALSSLQAELDQAFVARNKLKETQSAYLTARQRYQDLESMLQVNQNLSLITLIEGKAKEMSVQVNDFPSQQEVAAPTAPLSNSALKNHRVAKIRFSINKAGLKKIIEFIVALESLPNKIRVTGLTVKRAFTDKLYLDANVEVEAILPPSL